MAFFVTLHIMSDGHRGSMYTPNFCSLRCSPSHLGLSNFALSLGAPTWKYARSTCSQMTLSFRITIGRVPSATKNRLS